MLNMFSVMIVAPLLLGLAFGAALLFLTARLWKVPGVTWRRSFALYLVLSVISLPGVLASRAVASLESNAAVLLLMLFFLCGQWLVVVKGLHTTYLRGLAVFLSVLAVSSAASVPAAYGIRRFYEAFTVPTGGMAPALIGRHGDQVCSNCGYAFPVSLSDWSKTSFGRHERQELLTSCSNCREPQTIGTNTNILSGDCFIVDKTAKATRWSLAAFRKPPERHETYLRRLVGLPGETVELIQGEVFIDGKLERKEPHVATDLWMPVHDTNFVPRNAGSDTPRWQPRDNESHWRQSDHRWIVQASGSEQHLLEFTGDITDLQSYNVAPEGQNRIRQNMVGDVLVTCSFESVEGSGSVRFDWAFAGATIEAEVRVGGDVEIKAVANDGGRARAAGHLTTPLASGGRLAFAVRDGQVYLQHNGQLAALALCGPDDADSFRSRHDGEREACLIQLSAANCSLVVKGITIQRDVYYIASLPEYGNAELRGAGEALTLGDDECYLLGDNSARSYDSRMFADVRSSDIFGVARLIYWPPKRLHAWE